MVAVATSRPPGEHEWRRVVVEAPTETQAELIACQMVIHNGVVMPTRSELIDILEI